MWNTLVKIRRDVMFYRKFSWHHSIRYVFTSSRERCYEIANRIQIALTDDKILLCFVSSVNRFDITLHHLIMFKIGKRKRLHIILKYVGLDINIATNSYIFKHVIVVNLSIYVNYTDLNFSLLSVTNYMCVARPLFHLTSVRLPKLSLFAKIYTFLLASLS